MTHSKSHRKAISRGLKAYHKRGKKTSKKYKTKLPTTSKTGHKSWRQRIKDEKQGKGRAGIWAHIHAKRAKVR